MQELLFWIKNSGFGHFMREEQWAFSICESIHFIGLSFLFGALMVIDIRMMGFFRSINIRAAMKLIPLAIFGFAINLITGICFIFTDPFQYWNNPMFRMKMVLVLLAGINAIYHEVACKERVCAIPDGADPDTRAKVIGGLSLGLWLLVMLAGRLLPQFAVEG
ncbi:MAG: hypothetical protein WCP82_11735 [Alphaproteobacteria bacterium]